MKKIIDANRIKFITYYGTATMGLTESLTTSLMSSFFMLYLTDYSGIGAWAASLGSALLVFARLFDAVNDPIEAWIMDKANPGKYGKYKPFVFLSIFLQTIGAACLFFIPTIESKILVAIWVIVFYLVYDVGYSFFSPEVIFRSITLDENQRAKLLIAPRIMTMFMGMIVASMISIVAKVNLYFSDYHTSFGVSVLVFLILAAIVSISGISAVKEKYISKTNTEDPVKITDIFTILKLNGAVRTRIIAGIFAGLIWNCLFATANYYVKWGFSVDLTTGAVDTAKYGLLILLTSIMMFIPILVGTAVSIPLMKKLGSAIKLTRLNLLIEAISCGLLALFHFLGVYQITPIPFFALMAICATAMGADFVPGAALTMESMDYEVYKNGRDRAATINTLGRLLGKAQSAFAAAAIGVVLTSVGYVVDSATDTYLGELSSIPSMMNWFIVIMGVIPFVFGIIAWFIYKQYPVTEEIRMDMKRVLSKS